MQKQRKVIFGPPSKTPPADESIGRLDDSEEKIMGRALIVGIDSYDNDAFANLSGCVNDAAEMRRVLETHSDGSPNFDCRLITTAPGIEIGRRLLRSKWLELFSGYDGDIVFYFAGHGVATPVGAALVTQDGEPGDPGLPMDELLTLANHAHQARSVLLILDCCHSGSLGTPTLFAPMPNTPEVSLLASGVTVIAASRAEQSAAESAGRGVFTELLVTALEGGAADTLGYVSSASMYAFVEQALGPWDQRPLYKTNAQRLRPVRRCKPKITTEELRRLTDFFTHEHDKHQLDPSYEHTRKEAIPANVTKFDYLKLLRDAGLLSTGGKDLFWLAVGEKPEEHNGPWDGVPVGQQPQTPGEVELTPLGRSFWRLVKDGRV